MGVVPDDTPADVAAKRAAVAALKANSPRTTNELAPGMAVAVPPITEPITTANARRLPRCPEEDGPGPCVWLADRMGNGVGHSFFIGRDFCTHYFTKRDEARWGDKTSPCTDPYASDAS